MDLKLNSEHVVVIGGTRGIGFFIALAFLDQNSFVHVIARKVPSDLKNTIDERHFKRIYFYESDATDKKSLQLVSEKILINSNNRIKIVISNVGDGKGSNEAIQSDEDWQKSWNINFNSALNSAKIFSEKIIDGGSLLFISSIAGKEFIGAPISYSVAKSAIFSLAKSLAHKLGPRIRVNVVVPGNIFIKDGVWDKKMRENQKKTALMLEEKVPMKRFGKPDEVANLVVFLSSVKASFISGAFINIAGGQTIQF